MKRVVMLVRLGFVGKAAVGKDALANYAAELYGFRRFAFADALKKYDKELFGETKGKNRKRLQDFGQFCRTIDPLVWVNQLDKQLKQSDGNAIITDIRQWNELEYCKQNGFVIIKVVADDEIRLERMNERGDNFTLEDLQHKTETEMDEFPYDYLIENNGTFNATTMQFDYIIRDLEALAKS
jgi:dephospho-CoA kinase